MAKSTLQNKFTAEYCHLWGEHYYELAADMEDRGEPQSKIDASWKMAAMEFWLTSQNYAKIPVSNKPTIVKSVQPRIDVLVKLVKQTHSWLLAKEVDVGVLNDQMTKFTRAIKLSSGKLIQSCFTKKIIQDHTKEKDLKSQVLELTRNLPIYDKAATNTINYLSKSQKAKALSKTDCGIL